MKSLGLHKVRIDMWIKKRSQSLSEAPRHNAYQIIKQGVHKMPTQTKYVQVNFGMRNLFICVLTI